MQIDPIYVTFNPSESDLADIQRARGKGKVSVEVMLPGESEPHHSGDLTFIDNAVDSATGTITARATIGNADSALLSGQYVRIRLHIRDLPDALLAPRAALGFSQFGNYLYVVNKEGRAEQRPVTVGPTLGDLVAVTGVTEEDKIIAGNLQKIGPGAPVTPLPPQKPAGS